MGLFDSITELIQNFSGNASDIVNNASENLPIDELTNLTDNVGDTATTATEEVTTKAEDIKNSLGQ